MTSTVASLTSVPDRDLLTRLDHAARHECQVTAQIIALLVEVDTRKLYRQKNCSSLFAYCVQVLHLAESAAYLRIEAARVAKRFPAILDRIADGSLQVATVTLIGPHLTNENHVDILGAVTHKSWHDVELLIARMKREANLPASPNADPPELSSAEDHLAG